MQPTVPLVIEFLQELFDKGMGYSAINTARSAISSVITLPNNIPLGTHPLVRRFVKGVYNLRPSIPRYQFTWDVQKVLSFLGTLYPLCSLGLKELTHKLVMLTALVTGQRCQSIHLMDISNMQRTDKTIRFVITNLVKQSRPGKDQPVLILPKYVDNKLCVVHTLDTYLDRTKLLRSNNKLFISTIKPHQEAAKDTISRWVKETMTLAGIDISMYSAHSTRSASSSAASRAKVPLTSIMKAASWSQEDTFAKFYHKPLNNEHVYGLAVIDSHST